MPEVLPSRRLQVAAAVLAWLPPSVAGRPPMSASIARAEAPGCAGMRPEEPATPEAVEPDGSPVAAPERHHPHEVDHLDSGSTPSRFGIDEEPPTGLAGDLLGLRRTLADAGVDLRAKLTLDSAWNTRGGLETGFVFMGLLDVNLSIRTEPLLQWNGG